MPVWLPLGNHHYHVEDDLFVLRGCGELSLDDTRELLGICNLIGDQYGYWLVLVDAHAGVGMSAEARRYIGEMSRSPRRISATAIYGAGVQERTLMLFVRNAVRLLRGTEMPVEDFSSEAAARSWLVARRPLLRSQLADLNRES